MSNYNHAIHILKEEKRHLETILIERKNADYERAKEIIKPKLKDLDEAIKKLEL